MNPIEKLIQAARNKISPQVSAREQNDKVINDKLMQQELSEANELDRQINPRREWINSPHAMVERPTEDRLNTVRKEKPINRIVGAARTTSRVDESARNPLWEMWKKAQPQRFNELSSGVEIAGKEFGVDPGLLMDISGLETSGGQNLNQFGGGPGRGYFQWEVDGQGNLAPDVQRRAAGMFDSGFDPMSATDSARLAASYIADGQLSRWGTPQETNPLQKNWGTVDNPRNRNGSLVNWYSPEELNPLLAERFRSNW